MQERLWAEAGVNWNDYPDGAKRGRVCVRHTSEEDIIYTDRRTGEEVATRAVRSRWMVDGAPHFTANADGFLADVIPPLPALREAETTPCS